MPLMAIIMRCSLEQERNLPVTGFQMLVAVSEICEWCGAVAIAPCMLGSLSQGLTPGLLDQAIDLFVHDCRWRKSVNEKREETGRSRLCAMARVEDGS